MAWNRFLLAQAVVLLSARISSCLPSSSPTQTASVTSTASDEPCAAVSSLQASYLSANPTATAAAIPAEVAYDCLKSVPIKKEDALNLVKGLSVFAEWQSTLAYLKDPPSGYQLPAVDIMGGLDALSQNISSGTFAGEYDFEVALTDLIFGAHDGHFAYVPDLFGVMSFKRTDIGPLVSVSEDGKQLPQVYRYLDLEAAAQNSTWKPSPIKSIDGQDVVSFLKVLTAGGNLQDPDSLYNYAFYEVSQSLGGVLGSFVSMLASYPGPSNTFVFQNGTQKTFSNYAVVEKDFTGVDSGEAAYSSFCVVNSTSTTTPTASASPATSTAESTATSNPRPQYPDPVVIHSGGAVAGYFLDGKNSDTAVLSITSFFESTDMILLQEFQSVVEKFLAECVSQKKKKLVVDLTANPGGTIALGVDTFKQLFPSLDPYGASNFRAHEAVTQIAGYAVPFLEAVRQAEPKNETALKNAGKTLPFDLDSYTTINGSAFGSWEAFYGPDTVHGDNFTNVARTNWNEPNYSLETGGIIMTGYGSRSDPAPQPFASEDIVLFTDGYCGSTCTIFAHMMKFQGKVKSIVAGGRPQEGPMQAIGGVKGSQVLQMEQIYEFAAAIALQLDTKTISQLAGTAFGGILQAGNYVVGRAVDPSFASVNFRNNIVEGDDTKTPAQFIYEAADCRIWWTPEMIFNVSAIWTGVADTAWSSANGTFSGCVSGSTGQVSSKAENVTLSSYGQSPSTTNSTGSTGSTGSPTTSTTSSTSTPTGGSNRILGPALTLALVPGLATLACLLL